MCYSDIVNKIELIAPENEINEILNKYANYEPRELWKFGNDVLYTNEENVEGFLNTKTNLFAYNKGGDVLEEIPEGFQQSFREGFWTFPTFDLIVPSPWELREPVEDEDDFDFDSPYCQWCLANWGTFQDAYEYETLSHNEFLFTSDYCVPALIEKISLQSPNVRIIYEYTSEKVGYGCGRYIFQNGEQQNTIFKDGSLEAKSMTYKIIPEYFSGFLSFNGKMKLKI